MKQNIPGAHSKPTKLFHNCDHVYSKMSPDPVLLTLPRPRSCGSKEEGGRNRSAGNRGCERCFFLWRVLSGQLSTRQPQRLKCAGRNTGRKMDSEPFLLRVAKQKPAIDFTELFRVLSSCFVISLWAQNWRFSFSLNPNPSDEMHLCSSWIQNVPTFQIQLLSMQFANLGSTLLLSSVSLSFSQIPHLIPTQTAVF